MNQEIFKILTIRLQPRLFRRLKTLSKRIGLSMSDLVRLATVEYLKHKEVKVEV